ncbi:hypothetical protein MRX96_029607 [Rhipicephalus microplus]
MDSSRRRPDELPQNRFCRRLELPQTHGFTNSRLGRSTRDTANERSCAHFSNRAQRTRDPDTAASETACEPPENFGRIRVCFAGPALLFLFRTSSSPPVRATRKHATRSFLLSLIRYFVLSPSTIFLLTHKDGEARVQR